MKDRAKKASTRMGVAAVAGAGMTFAFPALAFASEEEAGGISAILPDMAEFIPMLVIFILLWIVLAKLGWPKFEAMLSKRETMIKDALEKSEEARIESERVLEEYRVQLAAAKAQSEATDMIAKARTAIEAEKKAAIAELQSSVADTSVAVAARLIGEDLSESEHRKMIERYVNEAGSFDAN